MLVGTNLVLVCIQGRFHCVQLRTFPSHIQGRLDTHVWSTVAFLFRQFHQLWVPLCIQPSEPPLLLGESGHEGRKGAVPYGVSRRPRPYAPTIPQLDKELLGHRLGCPISRPVWRGSDLAGHVFQYLVALSSQVAVQHWSVASVPGPLYPEVAAVLVHIARREACAGKITEQLGHRESGLADKGIWHTS